MTAASTRNIYQRMHAVMQEVDYVQKEKKAGMRYSIVSHDAVTAKVRPLMVKHGIIYYPTGMNIEQVGNRTQLTCQVIFQNIDDSVDRMIVDSAGYGIDDQDKGPGKAISYAVKYALLKACGLETGDDPDQDQEVQHKPPPTYERSPIVRAEFTRLQQGVHQIEQSGNLEDLALFWKNNTASIKALPADWREELEGIKDNAKEALSNKVAA